MIDISRESEINLINILIDQDIISGKDLIDIKKASSEGEKSQLDAVFELKLTDEDKILDLLVKEQSLQVVDLSNMQIPDDVRSVLPSNYIRMNFIAPFKIEGKTLHIAISDSSKLSLMRNLKTITKKDIELHAAKVTQISDYIQKLLKEGETTIEAIQKANKEKIFSEEKAREWRYKKLCERAKTLLNKNQEKHNIYLLTGHTSSDNAETFILNLSRGSNFAGLSNIESKRLIENQIYLIRPILIFSREDTKQFCNDMKIPVWEDPTNSDLKLKRNLVRKKIIPTLEVIYPGCSERINNFSQKMSKYNNERNDLSELAYFYCKDVKGIDRNLLNGMCIEARCTILNRFLKEISAKQCSSKNLIKLATSIYEKNKGQINLQELLKIVWDKNYINFEKS